MSTSPSGVTLIEVMVGIVLSAILVIGLSGLWSVVNHHFLGLTLKQKAIFVLHGEMERLAALYTWGAHTAIATERALSACDSQPNCRMYQKSGVPNGVVVTQSTVFESTGNQGAIFYYDADSTPDSGDENVVWIDRERNISGRLAWTEDGVAAAGGCYLDSCKQITLYLDFPYRYNRSNPLNGMGNRQFLTLQTLVGRRE
ncbi:MAG: prepilin-type N-terminal cleavage/methylation domain-containing protein [Gammaproteobacteria bacterium]|jgi:prepilin-type N-terminal cleavage/methylation domain-containing protein|nr:prepilin-type N-terminal cleavage/methylation domain-containing protein [Gammaproteobacteria bacterium]MBT7308387.1 prepilin-type N-terminal cleavage/methylation domain-containing protein [Gammaproteobacteria bacterium]